MMVGLKVWEERRAAACPPWVWCRAFSHYEGRLGGRTCDSRREAVTQGLKQSVVYGSVWQSPDMDTDTECSYLAVAGLVGDVATAACWLISSNSATSLMRAFVSFKASSHALEQSAFADLDTDATHASQRLHALNSASMLSLHASSNLALTSSSGRAWSREYLPQKVSVQRKQRSIALLNSFDVIFTLPLYWFQGKREPEIGGGVMFLFARQLLRYFDTVRDARNAIAKPGYEFVKPHRKRVRYPCRLHIDALVPEYRYTR